MVQDYLEYFEGDRPYYMELYCFGGAQKNHEILTVKDMDFYHSVSMLSHESDQTIEYQCVALGDWCFCLESWIGHTLLFWQCSL